MTACFLLVAAVSGFDAVILRVAPLDEAMGKRDPTQDRCWLQLWWPGREVGIGSLHGCSFSAEHARKAVSEN